MGLLEWGDMYKRSDALGFTSSQGVEYQPPRLASLPSPSYNIREALFETDEDMFLDMVGKDFQAGSVASVYPTYAPSHQKSSFSLNPPGIAENDYEEIYFPSYDDVDCSDKVECLEPVTEASQTQWSASPHPVEHPEDDSAIRVQPSRQVDYLSHDWIEEDVWASWKHIVSKRGAYNNSARLENASWRSWAKKRSNLRTVPPETVKWMKDHDLTWLYGPLTSGSPYSFGENYMSSIKGRRLSRANIARHSKKPILKMRSLSEIMLRRSVSSSLFLKQAVVSKMGNSSPQSSPFESPALTRSKTDTMPSKSTSGLREISDSWKKVQFHELVEQCIALANAGDDDQEYQYCSDSDSDVIVMRKTKKRATTKLVPSIERKAKTTISKTIEKLPHAPLKDIETLEDVPEEDTTDQISDDSESTSPSSQLDTSGSISMDHDSDGEDEMDWQPPAWLQGRKDSVQIVNDRISDFRMQQDEATQETKSPLRPQLERRDASTDAQEVSHVQMPPWKRGSDVSIKFDLPPTRSQISNVSLETPRYQRPRDDYFMMDPGMTEGESDASVEMARSASQSSETSERSNPPVLALDNFQRIMVDRVMSEFWALFNQQCATYSQRNPLSPLSPTGPATPLSIRKKRRGGCRQLTEESNYFETIPDDDHASPDSKELAEYEYYIHRELPHAVRRSIEDAVRHEKQPKEAHLVGTLVNTIHECEDKLFQSYFEEPDRVMRGLSILSMNHLQSSTVPIDPSHHHSEILDAAFQRPPLKDVSNYRSPLRSSTLSSAPRSPSSAAPTTPRDTVFSDSGYASEKSRTMTSSNASRRDTDVSKWSLPKEIQGKDGRPIREIDLYEYDEIDEALAWAKVY